ncbi:hypothetical protein PENTCL1PPCAC_12224, partial [Pristionchus entomophagus]
RCRMTQYYQLYRETTAGIALKEVLDQMMDDDLIPKAIAQKVLCSFDKNMSKALGQRAKNRVQFKAGKLVAYRYCDNVWTLVMDNVEFRDVHRSSLDAGNRRMKFVACDGRAPGTNTDK